MHQTLVVGFGKTGRSIARYLQRKQRSFALYDTRINPAEKNAFIEEFPGVNCFCGEYPDSLYASLSLIIASPGVPLDAPVLQKARARNIPIVGDIECLVREVKAPIVAITGTNGKSTVTTLVGEMAKCAGIQVAVAGNIGTPVLDLLEHHYDLWVLELSSFQLDLVTTLSPIASVILNISPDHLDRHHTLEAYKEAKHRIYHRSQVLLYNREDAQTKPNVTSKYLADYQIISYGLTALNADEWGLRKEDDELYLAKGQENIFPVSMLKIKGRHNWSNALAACALAEVAGIKRAHMKHVLESFTGLPHRAQWVRRLNDVDWINDSKGTNIGATYSAIEGIGGAMQGKIVLIAGGLGKGADFSELCQPVKEYVRTVVLFGADADKIEAALKKYVPISRVATLEEAVDVANMTAKKGDVVMLSPACASQDMFRDFNHRGEVFTDLVNAL